MIRLLLVPLLLSAFISCTDQKQPAVPSYQEALKAYQEKNKAQMAKMPAEALAVMKQASASLAQQLPEPGLKLGETAPDFSLQDAEGNTLSLSSALKNGPVVLVFYRGAWCPYCNLHLHALTESLDAIKQHGGQLIAVTPQKPDKSAEQFKKTGYPFPVLSDLDSRVMKAYRLHYTLEPKLVAVYKKMGLNLEDFNGPGRNELPVPGTFVIDRQGIVRARHAEIDYKQRMEPKAIIQALAAM